jgi:ferredoxin-NADP reductase
LIAPAVSITRKAENSNQSHAKMNELFHCVQNGKEIVVRRATRASTRGSITAFQEWRFHGDRAAFLRADFGDFSALLSNNAIWLNDNLLLMDTRILPRANCSQRGP